MKFLEWIFVGLLICGCAVKQSKVDPQGIRMDSNVSVYIESEARGLFLQAEKDFQARNYPQSLSRYQQIRAKLPKSKAAEISHYRIGSIYYYQEEYSKSAFEFDQFLKKYPLSSFYFDAVYNLSASQYQLNQYDKVKQNLERLKRDDIRRQGAKRALTYFQLQALNALAQSDYRTAALASSHQVPFISDEANKRNLEDKISKYIEQMNSAAELQDVAANASDPQTKALASKRLAALGAEGVKTQVVNQVSDAGFFKQQRTYSPALELGSGSKGSKRSVGVVLPLKGKFAPYGRRALDGILLAAKMFQQAGQEPFEIFVEDSGSSPSMARAALENLFYEKNVMAVIGPLNFKEGLVVAEKAQELGVVNISLASKPGVSQQGPYIFQNALTPRVQLEHLIRYCTVEQGLRRFAVLAPSNAFGRDMANEFWSQIETQGGRVVAVEFYSPTETDFQDQVKSMVGLKDVRFRKTEWTALQEYVREQKLKTGREPKPKLKPIIDFEAIFIPDSPKTVAAIAANLAYFDINEVTLMGTTEWNSDQLYKRGGRFVEKALFPGVMNPVTRSAAQRDFMRNYQEAFGAAPDLLAAQGYEAMELIAVGIQKSQSTNRADLAKQIASIQNLEAPIGMTSFDENRIANRNIPLYTLDRFGNFIEQ